MGPRLKSRTARPRCQICRTPQSSGTISGQPSMKIHFDRTSCWSLQSAWVVKLFYSPAPQVAIFDQAKSWLPRVRFSAQNRFGVSQCRLFEIVRGDSIAIHGLVGRRPPLSETCCGSESWYGFEMSCAWHPRFHQVSLLHNLWHFHMHFYLKAHV